MAKQQRLFELTDKPKTYYLSKSSVMRLAVAAGYRYQADVYKRLGKDETTWARRFKSVGWSWESILALCYVLECTPEKVMQCQR